MERVRPHLAPLLLLLLVAFALYGKALGHDFLSNWDDRDYVTTNPDIMGFTVANLRHAFTNYYVGNYAPLQIVSYMLDYSLGGLNSGYFIFTNILFHALNAMLYYALLMRISGRRMLALVAALLFLCHPVQVESVVWISQRKTLLAMFFFLISFLQYLNWKERRLVIYYVISLAAFALALLSKSVVVVMPLLLICYDLCFRERETLWLLVRDKLLYLALAVACIILALQSHIRIGGIGADPWIIFLNMVPVFSKYLVLLFAPFQLSIIYNGPIKTAFDMEVVLSLLVISLCLAAWLRTYRHNRSLFFWCSLFVLGLLPVANIIPIVTLMNDRYLYFPMLGFAAFIGHLPIFAAGNRVIGRVAALRALFAAFLLMLTVITWRQIDVWQDSITLWTDAVTRAKAGSWYLQDSNFIKSALAEALTRRGFQAEQNGSITEARRYYVKALAYDPSWEMALSSMGRLYFLEGKHLLGRPYLIRLTEVYPHDDKGFVNLGTNYYLTGELKMAVENLTRALKINPGNEIARKLLREIVVATGGG
jgi:tetratricopeptide (TPR) repeat protein